MLPLQRCWQLSGDGQLSSPTPHLAAVQRWEDDAQPRETEAQLSGNQALPSTTGAHVAFVRGILKAESNCKVPHSTLCWLPGS